MPNGLTRLIIAFMVMLLLGGLAARAWEWHREKPDDLRRIVREWWRSLRTRWSARAYLIVHFLVGLGASLAALAFFSLITIGIVRKQRVTLFDQWLADAIHRHSTDIGNLMAGFASGLGDPRLMLALFAIGATLLWFRRNLVLFAAWIVAFAGGTLLEAALRIIFRRDRPLWVESFATGNGFSFPSGHVMGALIAWGMLACVLLVTYPRRRWSDGVIGIGLVTLVGAIGFSRIYLGVHYLSDVIAGLAAGTLWLATCVTAVEVAQGEQDRRAGQRRGGSRGDRSDRRHEERRHPDDAVNTA